MSSIYDAIVGSIKYCIGGEAYRAMSSCLPNRCTIRRLDYVDLFQSREDECQLQGWVTSNGLRKDLHKDHARLAGPCLHAQMGGCV
jgi:hypothetical protein